MLLYCKITSTRNVPVRNVPVRALFLCLVFALSLPAAGQVVSTWVSPIDGVWSDPSNWSTDPLAPVTPGYEAVVDATGSPYLVTLNSAVAIDRLTIDSPEAEVLLAGGSLSATAGVDANASPLIFGAGLIHDTVLAGAAGIVARDVGGGYLASELRDVTLATTLRGDADNPPNFVKLSSTLTLDGGIVDMANGLNLFTQGPLTVGGNGAILTSGSWRLLEPNTTVTIQPGVTVRAESGKGLFMAEYNFPSGRAKYINDGVLESVGGSITLSNTVDYYGENGVLRATNGGSIEVRATRGDVGQVELGPNSSIRFGLGGYTFSQPVLVPEGAELDIRSSWTSQTTITVDGGSVKLYGSHPVTGAWDWQPGSKLEVQGEFHYSKLTDYGIAADTQIEFLNFVPSGYLQLGNDRVDVDALPGEIVLRNARITGGEIVGLPRGGILADPQDSLTLSSTVVDTATRVEAGRLRISSAEIRKLLTVNGGSAELAGTWSNTGGIQVNGGTLYLGSLPASLGSINLDSGSVVLTALPTTPGELAVSGGTIELENASTTTYTVADLQTLPWTPESFAAGYRSIFDLEGATYDLSTAPWEIDLGGYNQTIGGVISNGLITKSAGGGPWQIGHGTLRDVTLQTDIRAEGRVSLQGTIIVYNARLEGEFEALSDDLRLDNVTIDGMLTVGRIHGSPTPVEADNLTINGELQLGTRMLRMEGSQTLLGSGVVTTDGIRSAPGGGVEVVGGALTIGEGFTFRSERNGSRLVSDGGTLRNQGSIIAADDDYANGTDVPAPSITITSGNGFQGAFVQEGLLQIADGYEIRVETSNFFNDGEIEIRGGLLTSATTRFENRAVIRGDGTIVAASDRFSNLGEIIVGDHDVNDESEAPGMTGLLNVVGDYTQLSAGSLLLDLAGSAVGAEYDRMSISGLATLDGLLAVSLLDSFAPTLGESFELITASDGFDGEFAQVNLPDLGSGLAWELLYDPTTVSLAVVTALLPGDFNGDGVVDDDDLARWQGDFGLNGNSDADVDGDSDGADFLVWQRNIGAVAPQVSPSTAIPEPSNLTLVLVSLLGIGCRCRKVT